MKRYIEIFLSFLWLGCISFGGPAAHIGYFRQTFVEKKKWLTDDEYGQMVALSQFLPGPGSSQVGFSIGLSKGGLFGACLAFIGFTLPSFLLMVALATSYQAFQDEPAFLSLVSAFKLLALVVVIDATRGMAESFCKNTTSQLIAVLTAIFVLLYSFPFSQLVALCVALVSGMLLLRENHAAQSQPIQAPHWLPLSLFVLALVLSLFFSAYLFSGTFVAGSLVFGGGHVVLPLLEQQMGSMLTQDEFLAGYAAAQAIPGPMFTFATYLGAMTQESPWLGALIATAGVFLPGFLLVLAFHESWKSLAHHRLFSGAIAGVTASVVGLLIATCYHPVFTSAVHSTIDIVFALVAFAMLRILKMHIIALVAMTVIWGLLIIN